MNNVLCLSVFLALVYALVIQKCWLLSWASMPASALSSLYGHLFWLSYFIPSPWHWCMFLIMYLVGRRPNNVSYISALYGSYTLVGVYGFCSLCVRLCCWWLQFKVELTSIENSWVVTVFTIPLNVSAIRQYSTDKNCVAKSVVTPPYMIVFISHRSEIRNMFSILSFPIRHIIR